MGKAENVKRAKKLKEAKRRHEQELLKPSIHDQLKSLISNSTKPHEPVITIDDNAKNTGLLDSFVNSIIIEGDESDIIKTKYFFAIRAWNAALIKEKSEEIYQTILKDILKITSGSPEMELLFDELVLRKQAEFTQHKNLFVDFKFVKLNEINYDIRVSTAPLTEEYLQSYK